MSTSVLWYVAPARAQSARAALWHRAGAGQGAAATPVLFPFQALRGVGNGVLGGVVFPQLDGSRERGQNSSDAVRGMALRHVGMTVLVTQES